MLASTVFKKTKGTGSAYNKALKTTPFGRSDAFTRGGFAMMPHANAPLSLMLGASLNRKISGVFKESFIALLYWIFTGVVVWIFSKSFTAWMNDDRFEFASLKLSFLNNMPEGVKFIVISFGTLYAIYYSVKQTIKAFYLIMGKQD